MHESALPAINDPQENLFQEINRTHLPYIMSLDVRDICLFLPHCLRSRDCPAPSDHEGIHCQGCKRCVIAELVSQGEACGLRVFCIPGGSLMEPLLRKYRPQAVIGVACDKEINLALELLWDKGIFVQVFPLERDGCFETSVNPDPILTFLTNLLPQKKRKEKKKGKKRDRHPAQPLTSSP